MIIKVHSVTDVITTSSTVIFTRVAKGAVEALHCLIYDLTGEPAADRFTFRVTSSLEENPDYVDELRWEYMRDLQVQDPWRGPGVAPVVADLPEEQQERMFKYLQICNPTWWNDWEEIGITNEDLERGSTFIEVKALDPKDDAVAKQLSKLERLFDAEEGADC